MGYSQGHGDDTLFVNHLDDKTIMILLVYVNDIIVTGNNEESNSLGQRLAALFEIKFLGKMRYFLDIEVAYSNQGISISQHKYTLISSRRRVRWIVNHLRLQ